MLREKEYFFFFAIFAEFYKKRQNFGVNKGRKKKFIITIQKSDEFSSSDSVLKFSYGYSILSESVESFERNRAFLKFFVLLGAVVRWLDLRQNLEIQKQIIIVIFHSYTVYFLPTNALKYTIISRRY